MSSEGFISTVLRGVCAAVLMASAVQAIPFAGGYNQDFDSLINSGSDTWFNNSTLAGWYAEAQLALPITELKSVAPLQFTGEIASLGSGNSSERALGGTALSGYVMTRIGLQLTNTSGGNLSKLTVAFDAEHWHAGSFGFTRNMNFSYRLGSGANLTAGTWVPLPTFTFDLAPGGDTDFPLDGNAPGNRTSFAGDVEGFDWAPGEELWFRWHIYDDGYYSTVGIDNLSIIPEPSTGAAVILAGALLAGRRRQRQARAA